MKEKGLLKPTNGAKSYEGSAADIRQDNAGQRKLDKAAAKKGAKKAPKKAAKKGKR